ncbi:MAG TPA: hypothetical protein VN699_03680 [Pirellulales bacterium]|nr:hypothetical protein [Pirellulales bacterium]
MKKNAGALLFIRIFPVSSGKPAATSDMFSARRDAYGFLFSVRRVLMNRSPGGSHVLPGWFSVNSYAIAAKPCEQRRGTRNPRRAAETLPAHLKP